MYILHTNLDLYIICTAAYILYSYNEKYFYFIATKKMVKKLIKYAILVSMRFYTLVFQSKCLLLFLIQLNSVVQPPSLHTHITYQNID